MKAILHELLTKGTVKTATWVACCKKGDFHLTEESLSYHGYPRALKEGQKVEIEIIKNYGFDPYDNQTHGIDYYDAAKITKYPDKKTKNFLTTPNMKKKQTTATTQLGYNYVYHLNEFENKWYCINRDSYLNYWSKNIKGQNDWTSGTTVENAALEMLIKNKGLCTVVSKSKGLHFKKKKK